MKNNLLLFLFLIVSCSFPEDQKDNCCNDSLQQEQVNPRHDSLQLDLMLKIELAKSGIRYPFVYDSTKDYILPREKWLSNVPPPYHQAEYTEFEIREGLRKRGDPDWNYACEIAEKKIKQEGGKIRK